jgi:predicted dienelactone hydrolase
MKHFTLFTFCFATALTAPLALAAQTAGFAEGALRTAHHQGQMMDTIMGRKMDYIVWYPAEAGAEVGEFAGNAVWQPVQAAENAAPIPARYPVVLMSHGLGGHYRSLAWLASELAKAGAVVVAVNHPNSTVFDFDMQAGLAHWTRPQDLTAALDHVLADTALGPLLDTTRVSAVGFSYGGWTALSLAGVRGNLAGYIAHCKAAPSGHCRDITRQGGDLAALEAGQWDGDYHDARITKVVSIDPGLTYGLTPADIQNLNAGTLLIQLGQGADRLDSTDISATGSGFAALVPAADVLEIAPAAHFSMLPLCTENGAAILQDENDDPVCTDPIGADRAAIHGHVIAATKAHLGLK